MKQLLFFYYSHDFDNSYYEIDNTTEVQFVGGLPSNNFSVVCSTFMVRKSALNIEERIK